MDTRFIHFRTNCQSALHTLRTRQAANLPSSTGRPSLVENTNLPLVISYLATAQIGAVDAFLTDLMMSYQDHFRQPAYKVLVIRGIGRWRHRNSRRPLTRSLHAHQSCIQRLSCNVALEMAIFVSVVQLVWLPSVAPCSASRDAPARCVLTMVQRAGSDLLANAGRCRRSCPLRLKSLQPVTPLPRATGQPDQPGPMTTGMLRWRETASID